MTDRLAQFARAPWSIESVEKLVELWKEGVNPELIAQTLRRPEADVRAKAAEMALSQHVEARG